MTARRRVAEVLDGHTAPVTDGSRDMFHRAAVVGRHFRRVHQWAVFCTAPSCTERLSTWRLELREAANAAADAGWTAPGGNPLCPAHSKEKIT